MDLDDIKYTSIKTKTDVASKSEICWKAGKILIDSLIKSLTEQIDLKD